MATAVATRSARNGSTPPVLDRDVEPPLGVAGEILQIPLDLIDVDANIRASVIGIEEFAGSIAEHGVRQPISVRDVPGERFAINFGQRRYLASKLAGLERIPAFVDNEARTQEQLAIHQLVENLAREDLPPLDRARAMRTVVDAGMSQADLARQLGLAASTVANDLRLLEASPAVHAALEKGEITPSHAKALLPLPAKEQDSFVRRAGDMSAHRLESEVGWALQRIRGEEQAKARTEKQAPRAAEALAAADVAKDVRVNVRVPYNMHAGPIEAAVKKAGWTLVEQGFAYRRGDQAKCDCKVVTLEFSRKWLVEPACVEVRHRDRQVNANHVEEEKRRKAIQAKVQRLKVAIAAVLEAGVPEPLVRLMAARNLHDVDEYWTGEDLAVVRCTAARNLAAVASSEYAWGDAREKADALFDRVLATFEQLVGVAPTTDAPAE